MNAPKKRLKAAESRRALLDAGFELLKERGVSPGLDRVTLKEAIERSGVPRSTAYRLYEGGRGQLEEFRVDFLADLEIVDLEPSMNAFLDVLEEVQPMIDSNDPAQMAAAAREMIRVGTLRNLESTLASLQWRLFMSSLAAVDTGPSGDALVTETFRLAQEEFGKRWVGTFEQMAALLGLRIRKPLTYGDLGSTVNSIIEGVALRVPIEPGLASLKRPTGVNGELQTWNAAGCALEALAISWFEADPAVAVSADLGTWTTWS